MIIVTCFFFNQQFITQSMRIVYNSYFVTILYRIKTIENKKKQKKELKRNKKKKNN